MTDRIRPRESDMTFLFALVHHTTRCKLCFILMRNGLCSVRRRKMRCSSSNKMMNDLSPSSSIFNILFVLWTFYGRLLNFLSESKITSISMHIKNGNEKCKNRQVVDQVAIFSLSLILQHKTNSSHLNVIFFVPCMIVCLCVSDDAIR